MARLGHRGCAIVSITMDPAPREAINQDMQTKSGSRNSVKQKVRIGKQDDNRPSTDLQGSRDFQ
jgi:hypothetical protein